MTINDENVNVRQIIINNFPWIEIIIYAQRYIGAVCTCGIATIPSGCSLTFDSTASTLVVTCHLTTSPTSTPQRFQANRVVTRACLWCVLSWNNKFLQPKINTIPTILHLATHFDYKHTFHVCTWRTFQFLFTACSNIFGKCGCKIAYDAKWRAFNLKQAAPLRPPIRC